MDNRKSTTNEIALPPLAAIDAAAHTLAERARLAGNLAYERAVTKAQVQAATGATLLAVMGAFLVESRTQPGTIYRVSHLHGCHCAAAQKGGACWHAALLDLITEANTYRVTLPAPRKSLAQIDAEMAECF